jgi:hypothetical protein
MQTIEELCQGTLGGLRDYRRRLSQSGKPGRTATAKEIVNQF